MGERAARVKWHDDDHTPPLLKYGAEMVDPFSFIYTLASLCGSRQSRTRVTESVAGIFDLEPKLPLNVDDAFYFPQGVPHNTLFHLHGEGNPGLLWNLFRRAVEGIDAVPEQLFRDALQIGNVGAAKLTQTLFLIDARVFIPYDKSTRRWLQGEVPDPPDWARYRAAIDELRAQFPGCEPYEINLFAYLTYSEKLAAGRQVFQVSTRVRGDEQDHWDDFNRNCWVYTGGIASGVGFEDEEQAAPASRYPLDKPDRGDIMLVRSGGEGQAMAIVWRNDYRHETTAETRLQVLWLNKQRAGLELRQQRGFSRAHEIERAFRRRAEYRPTFAVLDRLRTADGLSKAAVLAALEEYDRLGRDGFLQHYRYAPARTRRIRHDHKHYDMKPIWRAAFGHMQGGHALTPDDERYGTNSNAVQRHLEDLGFTIDRDSAANSQPLNQILYGPPGTGKTWRTVNLALAIIDGQSDGDHDLDRFNRLRFDPGSGAGNIAMVTFHQNFAYEDFVEGIRPVLAADGGELKYELHQGLFKRIAEAASDRRDERFVLIIDEINRGNIARIFGELITLVEDSRRTGQQEETWVSLPYSQKQFGVPDNLYLIGTMNTADRSIQLLDTALRRRFTFVEMMPDYRELTTIQGVDCAQMLRTMNERIAVLGDRERQIGHAYLLNLTAVEDLAHRFRNQLFPLLQEYFFDDWSRIKAVLGKSPFVVERSAGKVVDNADLIDEDRKIFERLPDGDPQWTSADGFRAIYGGAPQAPEES